MIITENRMTTDMYTHANYITSSQLDGFVVIITENRVTIASRKSDVLLLLAHFLTFS